MRRKAAHTLVAVAVIPFAATGAFVALLATNTALGLPALIGMLLLVGIVVTNAIVLIDYTNLVRSRKREELGIPTGSYLAYPDLLASIVESGKTRLRPVLLTAITTVLGLIPLAIGMNINFATLLTEFDPQFYIGGDNAAFWGPMAWTVIFGLTFATVITLVLVPVMYLLTDKLSIKLRR